MSGRIIRGLPLLGLLMMGGCLYPVTQKIDATVCDLSSRPLDLQPSQFAPDQGRPPTAPSEVKPASYQAGGSKPQAGDDKPKGGGKSFEGEGADKPGGGVKSQTRLRIPKELMPGGDVPDLDLENKAPAQKKRELQRFLPRLPDLGEDHPFPPGPEGRPLTLSDLQKLATANSPLIKQAVARVEEARGNAIQVGLPPNPTLGAEIDTYGTTGGAGYMGGFIDQVIRTANKLQLARASAAADVRTAELDLFRARTDLATRVRGGYFAVLVAGESIRLNRGLVKFTTEVYHIQVDAVGGGFAAAYEPMYLRALAIQARAALVQARNRHTAAWKQLAAVMGVPGMPPTQLAGRIDMPLPAFDYADVLARVLSRHSSLRGAEVSVQKAKYDLELARRQPIPDVEVRAMFQKDRTGAPYEIAGSLAVSVAVPIWNRNQGGIMQAQAAFLRAMEESHRLRSELTNTLTDAFERYRNAQVLLVYYRDLVLPDLVRVYRSTYERWNQGVGDINISDIVVAQQNMATSLATYITTLGQMWQSVVDVTDLLQTPDLFGIEGPKHAVAEIPDLEKLGGLPCCHPCSPVPNLHHRVLDGAWPQAAPPMLNLPRSSPQKQPTLPQPTPADRDDKGDMKGKDRTPAGKRLPPPGIDPLLLEPPPPLPTKR